MDKKQKSKYYTLDEITIRVCIFVVIPLGSLGGSQEACRVSGPMAVILGGGWFCGGAEAVRRDSGGLEVHPPEEHAC